jgi:hypothetical protein
MHTHSARQHNIQHIGIPRHTGIQADTPTLIDPEHHAWEAQEDRVFGQLAQESDHLFDTSYDWTT